MKTKKWLVGTVALACFALPSSASAVLTEPQATAILNLLTSFKADASVVANVSSVLRGGVSGGTRGTIRFTRVLELGTRGEDVRALQQFFVRQGCLTAVTGTFGPLTESCVKQLQADAGIVSSGSPGTTGWGIVGQRTQAFINSDRVSPIAPSTTPSRTTLSTTPSRFAAVADFAKAQESKYALPDTYAQIRQYLTDQLSGPNSFDNQFLNIPLATRRGESTCNGTATIEYYNGPRNWADISRAAELFRSGSIITKGDPEYPDLSNQLRAKFLSLTDYIIENANATHFYNDTAPGHIGWNNLASPWDAWGNGTCSPAGAPNLYASYEALTAIADAYIATRDPKYQTAFINGSIFWNGGFWPKAFRWQYDQATEQAIRAKAASYGPYTIASTYTVGGSRFSPSTAPDQLVIRYHFYPDDPGYFALEDLAGMGVAMTLGGVGSPWSSYTFPDGSGREGGTVERSFSNIGYYTMLGVAGNLAAKNYGYDDIDYVYHTSNDYNPDATFSAYQLARAGVATNNTSFQNIAREAALDILNTVTPATLQQYNNDVSICLVRQLDPKLLDFCKNAYQRFKNENGVTFYVVWPIINVL